MVGGRYFPPFEPGIFSMASFSVSGLISYRVRSLKYVLMRLYVATYIRLERKPESALGFPPIPSTCLSVIWQEHRDPNIEEIVLWSLDFFRFYISILKIHAQRHEN